MVYYSHLLGGQSQPQTEEEPQKEQNQAQVVDDEVSSVSTIYYFWSLNTIESTKVSFCSEKLGLWKRRFEYHQKHLWAVYVLLIEPIKIL